MHLLFVCHGNICRSTMAESVMAHLLTQAHLDTRISVDSAATSTEEIGNPPHYGTQRELARRGIPLRPHRARQITRTDAEQADLILAMDHANVRNLKRMLPPKSTTRFTTSSPSQANPVKSPTPGTPATSPSPTTTSSPAAPPSYKATCAMFAVEGWRQSRS